MTLRVDLNHTIARRYERLMKLRHLAAPKWLIKQEQVLIVSALYGIPLESLSAKLLRAMYVHPHRMGSVGSER